MYLAEYESEEGIGFAMRSTLERRQQTEAESRRRVCQLLELDETDPRATYVLWGLRKQDGRPSRNERPPKNPGGNGGGPPEGDPPNGPPRDRPPRGGVQPRKGEQF